MAASAKGRNIKQILRLGIVLVLTAFFVWQMVDMLIKYINKDTTMTFGRVEHKDLTFPGLALCPSPGYKSAAVAEVSDLDDPWEYGGSGTSTPLWKTEPGNNTQLMEWYNSTTYDPEEIVRFSKLVKGEEELKKEDGAVIVDGINSWLFGRCARLSFPLHITRESNIVLNVIFPSDVQEQHLYFLNPSGNVDAGIQVDVWVGSYIDPLYLKRDDIFKIGLDKRVETFLPEKQDCTEFPTETADNWQECIKKEAKNIVSTDGSNETFCFWPRGGEWLPEVTTEDRPPCTTVGERTTTAYWSKAGLRDAKRREAGDCKSCQSETFRLSMNKRTGAGSTRAKLIISFSELLVEEAHQVLLYDWNDVLNGIGGAMGLFLGFSLLSIADSVGDWLEGLCGKKEEEEEEEGVGKWAQESRKPSPELD